MGSEMCIRDSSQAAEIPTPGRAMSTRPNRTESVFRLLGSRISVVVPAPWDIVGQSQSSKASVPVVR